MSADNSVDITGRDSYKHSLQCNYEDILPLKRKESNDKKNLRK